MSDHSTMGTTSSVNAAGSQDDLLSLSDDEFARTLGLPVDGEEVAEEQPRNEKGQFTKVEDEEPEEVEEVEEVEEAEEVEAEAEAEESPKAEEAKEEPKLATKFEAFDDEGAYDVGDLAKVKIKFQANGKEREKTFDEVVRLAQFGFYNQEVATERDQLRTENPKLKETLDQALEQLEAERALNMQLLQDEDYYIETREMLKEQLTPEARARRAESALASREAESQARQTAAEAAGFTQQVVMPKLEALKAQYPSITEPELIGLFHTATAPLTRNGTIPRQAWGKVVEIIDGEIGHRMAQLHESRAESTKKATEPLKRKVKRAQEEATKTKRTLARAVSASTGGGSTASLSAAKKTVDRSTMSADQAIESIAAEVEEQIRALSN